MLLYYLFSRHHWTPEMYWSMSVGARDLAWALASYECEQIKQDNQ